MHSPKSLTLLPPVSAKLRHTAFDVNDPRGVLELRFEGAVPMPAVRALRIDLLGAGTDALIECRVGHVAQEDAGTYRLEIVPARYNSRWTHPDWATLWIQTHCLPNRCWVEDVGHVVVHWHGTDPVRIPNSSCSERPLQIGLPSKGDAEDVRLTLDAYLAVPGALDTDFSEHRPDAPRPTA